MTLRCLGAFCAALVGFSPAISAGDVIVQAEVTFSTMGDQPGTPITSLVDQTGLATPYVSGITAFEPYATETPHHIASGYWNSAAMVSSGVMVFDLGSVCEVSAMALWQHSNFFHQAIKTIALRADVDGDFSSGAITIGTFDDVAILEPKATILSFAPVTAQYIEWTITNYGNGFGTRANEVAFRAAGPLPWTDLRHGLSGSLGVPVLTGSGSLTAGSSNQLNLVNANLFSTAVLVFGVMSLQLPFKGGTMVPTPIFLIPMGTDGAGSLSFPFLMPGPPLPPELYFQYWISDPAGPSGYSASNGLKGTTS